jgi:hypothetical protein
MQEFIGTSERNPPRQGARVHPAPTFSSFIFMVSRGKSERDRKEMLRNLRSYLLVALLIALLALSRFTKITDGLEKYYEMMDEADKVIQKFKCRVY